MKKVTSYGVRRDLRDAASIGPRRHPALRTAVELMESRLMLSVTGNASNNGLLINTSSTFTNPSFETGDFTGYTTIGDAAIESAATLFETPTNGTYEALIQTTKGSIGSTASPVAVATLGSFTGTGTQLDSNPSSFKNGSAFRATFSATAGSSLAFDTNFLTDEPTNGSGNPDQAFVYLLNGTTVAASSSLGLPTLATHAANASDPIFADETGYSTTTFGPSDFTTPGTYKLEFIVLNAGNENVDSGLLVDNINLALGPKATPTISASQQPATAAVGSSIADMVTLIGGGNPTGTVTFDLYSNSNGTGTPLFTDTETLASEAATSAGYTPTTPGTDYWIATYNGDSINASVASAAASQPVVISLASPTIGTTQQPATATFGAAIADKATVSGGYNPTGTVTFNLYNNSAGTGTPLFTDTEALAGGNATSASYTPTAAGTDYWVATYNGNTSNSTASSSSAGGPVVVSKGNQAISFTAPSSPITFAPGETVPLAATGGASTSSVVFSIDPTSTGTGNIVGSTLTVTAAGTFVLDANQAADSNYNAAPQVQQTLAVSKAGQSISFFPPTSPITFAPGETVPLSAIAGASTSPVVFSVDPTSTGAGNVIGSTLTVTAAGNIVLDANQAGDTNYNAAPQVQETLVVSPGDQSITFTPPASPITYAPGETVPLAATGGGSTSPVVFSIDAASSGTGTINGSTLTVTNAGTLVIDANQAADSNYNAAPQAEQFLTVNPADQSIAFTPPASPMTYAPGETVPLVAAGGGSTSPVLFSIDPASSGTGNIVGSTLTVTSAGILVVDANQAADSNYNAAPQAEQTLTVNLANQSINFTPPTSPVTYVPNEKISLAATGGGSSSPVVFSIDHASTGAGTIAGNTLTVTAAGSFVLDANQAGDSNYNAAPQVQQTLVVTNKVNKVTPVFSGLSNPTIVVHTTSIALGGRITTTGSTPTGSVAITFNGVTKYATIASSGYFAAVFPSASLAVLSFPVKYSYGGNGSFNAVSAASTLKVIYAIHWSVNANPPSPRGVPSEEVHIVLVDVAGANIIAPGSTQVIATGYSTAADPYKISKLPPDNPNPVFAHIINEDHYEYTLAITGVTKGQYILYFTVTGDATVHSLTFTVT